MKKPFVTHCPICNKPITWTPENKYRPFCSYRCQLIDLGEWANESYQIQSNENDPDDFTESSNNDN